MNKPRLRRLIVALARAVHDLEQVQLGDPSAVEACCAVMRQLREDYPEWKLDVDTVWVNSSLERRLMKDDEP